MRTMAYHGVAPWPRCTSIDFFTRWKPKPPIGRKRHYLSFRRCRGESHFENGNLDNGRQHLAKFHLDSALRCRGFRVGNFDKLHSCLDESSFWDSQPLAIWYGKDCGRGYPWCWCLARELLSLAVYRLHQSCAWLFAVALYGVGFRLMGTIKRNDIQYVRTAVTQTLSRRA